MKIERLYAIMVYLLDHGKTPASELADYFEVSREIWSPCALQGFQFVLRQE